MKTPNDLITALEARALLNVSRAKLSDLFKRGILKTYENPLDRREKLVSKAEVLDLRPKRAEAA